MYVWLNHTPPPLKWCHKIVLILLISIMVIFLIFFDSSGIGICLWYTLFAMTLTELYSQFNSGKQNEFLIWISFVFLKTRKGSYIDCCSYFIISIFFKNHKRKSEQAHIPHAPTLRENAVYNKRQFQALVTGNQS